MADKSQKSLDDISKTEFFRLRIALAVAILKNKPKEVSVKQFIDDIVKQEINEKSELSLKCDELQREVDKLREELMVSQLESSGYNSLNESSQEYLSDQNFQCISNIDRFPDIKDDDPLTSVQSLTRIISYFESRPGFGPIKKKMEESLVEIVEQVMKLLRGHRGLKLPESLFYYSLNALTNLWNFQTEFHINTNNRLKDVFEKFIQALVDDIMNHVEVENQNFQERRRKLILKLFQLSFLSSKIAERLVYEVCKYGNYLRENCLQNHPNVASMENISYVLSALETAAESGILVEVENRKKWNENLDNCLRLIAGKYTMFAIYVWKIQSLFRQDIENQTKIF